MKKERKERAVQSVDSIDIKRNVEESNYTNDEKVALENFAINLNNELEIQNIKQDKLAEKINISTGALSSYRNGKRFPESRILYALSKELHVSLDYLFGLSDLKSSDVEFKRINEITGLSDDAINNLKNYNDFSKDKDSLEPLKNGIKDKLSIINYLIENEEDIFLFSVIASFMFYSYETNYENMLYKNIDKDLINSDDLMNDKKIWDKNILLKVQNQNITRVISTEDINKLDFILIQEKLTELKNKYNNK